jgi:endogenous inhibitor of DNA gyrase (YacG/DUF329 family)
MRFQKDYADALDIEDGDEDNEIMCPDCGGIGRPHAMSPMRCFLCKGHGIIYKDLGKWVDHYKKPEE